MNNKSRNYNSINWNKIFAEDTGSPTGLRWKISTNRRIKAGSVAGCIMTKKNSDWQYFQVRYDKTQWLVHRVLWVMRNGSIDASLDIDHINGDSLNNSVENLRLVSTAVNLRNQKRYSTNTTGVTGVCFKSDNGHTYAVARWCNLAGERESKSFSCKKLGKELAFSMACEYRQQMIEQLNNTGAGYSERHGNI